MRKLNVLEFVSLDGVIQAPGGPEEDTSGGFAYGGWTSPHSDPVSSTAIRKQMNMPFDLFKEIGLERSPLLLSARFYASECLHNCGTERGRQDDFRAGISAELRGLQELRQRRPDCPGYGPILAGNRGLSRWQTHAQ